MIEAGSEWFHRDSLTLVTVYSMLHTVEVHPTVGAPFDVSKSAFLRDYARNEPVTLELLERMGWEMDDGSAAKVFNERGPWWLEWTPETFGVEYGGRFSTDLPRPATLRDLLQTLRVFGVSCPIPEPVEAK